MCRHFVTAVNVDALGYQQGGNGPITTPGYQAAFT